MPDSFTMAPPGCVGPEDAGRILGVARKTLDNWRWAGGGPLYLKVGRNIWYRRSDLDRWLLSRLRSSTSDPGPAITSDAK